MPSSLSLLSYNSRRIHRPRATHPWLSTSILHLSNPRRGTGSLFLNVIYSSLLPPPSSLSLSLSASGNFWIFLNSALHLFELPLPPPATAPPFSKVPSMRQSSSFPSGTAISLKSFLASRFYTSFFLDTLFPLPTPHPTPENCTVFVDDFILHAPANGSADSFPPSPSLFPVLSPPVSFLPLEAF